MSVGALPLRGLAAASAAVAFFSALSILLCAPASSALPSSGSSLAMRPGSFSNDDGSALDFYKRLYDFGLGKRSSNAGSLIGGDYENKRIPSYSFGLGKRGSDRLYSFGLGKRYGKPYSFGIGKREYEEEEDEEDDEGEDAGEEEGEEWGEEWSPEEEVKRARQLYSFGLGKRSRQYGFGIGKRARPYSFGIGKRYPRYGFGIGKRAEYPELEELAANEEQEKRDHRFSFGLGKREAIAYDSNEDKRSSKYYDFGLGKRSEEEEKRGEVSPPSSPSSFSKVKQYAQQNGFGRAGRRTYSFGLGKRLPMYDFGLGKREERAATSSNSSSSINSESTSPKSAGTEQN